MRILIAEDDPVSRRLLEAMLKKWGYEVVVASDGGQALERLQAPDAPGVAVLDWMMPGIDGAELCRRVRARRDGGYFYLILLTARGQKEDLVEGMQAGADDYITKPFDSGELRVRLRAAERILNLQTELLAAQEALRQQATHDALTGLWNRRAILDTLQKELERSGREGRPSMRTGTESRRNLRRRFLHGSGSTFYQRITARTIWAGPNMASEAAAAYSPGVGSRQRLADAPKWSVDARRAVSAP